MQHSKVEFANTWVIKYSVIQKNAQVNYAIMHIESWFCTRTRKLDCLVCLINSWISYLNQIFIWSSFNHDIPFLGFLSLLVLGKVMWETKPLLEYFVSKAGNFALVGISTEHIQSSPRNKVYRIWKSAKKISSQKAKHIIS